jgi:TonB family protein
MTETALSNLAAWAVQVGLLTLAAAAVTRVLHIDAPAVRYGWWRAVLAVCLALPVIQPWRPPVSVESATFVTQATPPVTVLPGASAGTVSGSPTAVRSTAIPEWPSIVGMLLAGGALLRLAWLGAGLMRLRRLREAGVPVDSCGAPDFWRALTDAGADVRYVASLRQPVTFGIGQPVVLLPGVLRTMSPDVQRAVLAHEHWHVKRRDWLWTLGEEVLRAIVWFHPAFWYLVSRVQSAREEVVDELSILSTNARRSYLEALLAFADEPAVYPAAPFARRRQLFNRMLLISREAVMSSRRIVATTAGMAGVLVISGWYGAQAFPLTGPIVDAAAAPAPQVQAQPRDPRANAQPPATSREEELKAATVADASNVTNWLELAKLQEQRGATTDAEGTFQSALRASQGSREVLMAMAGFFNRTGQFDKTMRALEDAAAQNPSDPSGHQLVAVYYWEKAQKDQRLTAAEKLMYIDAGISATDRALAQRSDHVEALTYKNIMLRMKANIETDPVRRQELLAEAESLRNRAIALGKQRATSGAPSAVPPGAPPPPPPPPPPAQDYQVDGQQAFRIGGNIPAPERLHYVRPVYPPEATAARAEGVVIVEALVDPQGGVRRARVLRSIPMFDQAATDAVQQWRFAPTLVDGVPVPVVITLTVYFTLP